MTKPQEGSDQNRKKDRHSKDYRMVRFPLHLYLDMEEIAGNNDRPTSWEFRRAIEEFVRKNKPGKQDPK